MLSSRGLVEFHAAQYSKALELFEQALNDDPTDVSARFYRAAARARLGDYTGAIADLRVALAAQPSLDQAQHSSALEARASLFLGIASLRCGQLEKTQASFERAAKDPERQLAAR